MHVDNLIDDEVLILRDKLIDLRQTYYAQQKTILFIEAYGSALSLLQHGIKNGYQIILLTANQGLCTTPQAIIDKTFLSIKTNTSDVESLKQLVTMLQAYFTFCAVIPGFEYFVTQAVEIAACLGLPAAKLDNMAACRNKFLLRTKLRACDIRQPKFYLVNTPAEMLSVLDNVDYPVICKPTDAAGSVNVKKVNNFHEASHAVLRIIEGRDILWGHRIANQALIEEYIAGQEYSVEGVVQNGQIKYFGITEKTVADQQEFVEIGHLVNPIISQKHKQAIFAYLDQVIRAIGLNYCPFHAECRMTPDGQPVLMEIAARMPGDKIGDLINLCNQDNYFDAIYHAYFGESDDFVYQPTRHAGIRFFYRPGVNCYMTIAGIDRVQSYSPIELTFYYKALTAIPAFPKALRRLGHVILAGDNPEKLSASLNEINQLIEFTQ